MSQQYTIADYLFDRIAEAGASEIFGVPGDFNLTFLDNIIASDKLRWVGNTNELNARYRGAKPYSMKTAIVGQGLMQALHRALWSKMP